MNFRKDSAGDFRGRRRLFLLCILAMAFFTALAFRVGASRPPGMQKLPAGRIAQRTARPIPGRWLVKFRMPAERLQKAAVLAWRESLLQDGAVLQAMTESGAYGLRPLVRKEILQNVKGASLLAGWMECRTGRDVTLGRMREIWEKVPTVAAVEPAYEFPIALQPDDPEYAKQQHLPQIRAPEAWDFTTGDSSVIVAVVDNGFDMDHLDLRDNFYTNWAELLGTPGIDDDGNGYVDDVHGYDFVEDDPDPGYSPQQLPGYGHGTHVAGIVAAVGNNGKEVTGVTWNCRILPLKSASDDNPAGIVTPNAYRAIAYAVEQGAKVINLSWGAYGFVSEAERDAINLAYRNGCVVVAAAGNEGTDDVLYPAGHHHVISVSWVDAADRLNIYGNYGKTVDLVAPGTDILSTVPSSGTGRKSGSSMASPVVAGVAALVWSLHPNWSVDQVVRNVVFSADDVDSLNPGYENLLGSGRVNAYRALQDAPFPPPPAKFVLRSFSLDDSLYGNGNQIIEEGEKVTLQITISNASLGGSPHASFRLDLVGHPDVSWDTRSLVATVPPDTDLVLQQPFVFTVPEEKSEVLHFTLHYSGENVLSGKEDFFVRIGRHPVLLVDDDDGQNNVEGFYGTPLTVWGLRYSYWSHEEFGAPPAELLKQFPIVVWFCEWAFPSLTPEDQAAIASYLSEGGSLFLSGQDIGWDLADPASENATPAAIEFYENILHARYIADDAEENEVSGEPGDPIGDGLKFIIYQPGRRSFFQYPDVIEPLDSARAIWHYGHHKGVGGLRHAGDSRLVYFGFGLEAIDSHLNTPPDSLSSARSEVFARILNFLHPLHHVPLHDLESPPGSVEVTASYRGLGLFPLSVKLHWLAPDGLEGISTMRQEGNTFAAEIPTEGTWGEFRYWFEIVDQDFVWYLPVRGAGRPFRFRIGEDAQPPEIYPIGRGNPLGRKPGYPVDAVVRDNAALDSGNVVVIYRYRSRDEDSARAVYRPALGYFTGEITGDFRYGDEVRYWFSARDRASPPNTAVSDPLSFKIGLENFEWGLQQWVRNDQRWALDASLSHSGTYSLTTEPGEDYGRNLDLQIATREPLDFTGATRLELQFYSRYLIEKGDYGAVELKIGDGPWRQIAGPIVGLGAPWKLFRVDLTPFLGNERCYLRFRFVSDGEQSVPLPGWTIDDIRIVQDAYITGVERKAAALPASSRLSLSVFPNPITHGATLEFQIPERTRIRVEVYNLLGQRVWHTVKKFYGPGRHEIFWSGRGTAGKPLPNGVYWVKILAGEEKIVRKVLLLH